MSGEGHDGGCQGGGLQPTDGPSRRRLLATLGATSLAGLAGCGGDSATATATGTNPPSPRGDVAGPPEREGWRVTFEDRFADGAVDWDTWTLGAWGEVPCAGGETVDVCFVEDHVAVENERLVLTASTETPDPPPAAGPSERTNEHSAGAVSTKDSFAQEFGYFEAAARIPDQPGTLPACWLFCDPTAYDWREIELFEKPGAAPADTVKMGTWFEADPDGPDATGETTDNEDRIYVGATEADGDVRVAPPVDETVHVYGLEWGPESLAWYVDGERVGGTDHDGVAEHLPGRELFWILNHNVYAPAAWVGDPADADFPNAVEFAWVRAWQHEEWA